jgi:hypothetical protein
MTSTSNERCDDIDGATTHFTYGTSQRKHRPFPRLTVARLGGAWNFFVLRERTIFPKFGNFAKGGFAVCELSALVATSD